MPKPFWICLVLVSITCVLIEASKKGKTRGGGWGSSNTGSNRNPSYPGNTGSNWNPSHGGNWNPNQGGNWNPNQGGNWNPSHGGNTGGSWNNYNKHGKPPKTSMKKMAGAAAVGAVGGFVLGSALSNMRYRFDNDMDYRYYNSYQNQMPDRVYRPVYQENTYVSEDRFVTDCYNTSMVEYVTKKREGTNGTDVDDVEVRVKSTIIKQMCVTEYQRAPPGLRSSSWTGLLVSPSLILFITLFVYFVVQ